MTAVDLDITLQKESLMQPWLCQLARDFEIQFIITKANVDKQQGRIHLCLHGSVEEIQRATIWLMTTGIHVETLPRALGV